MSTPQVIAPTNQAKVTDASQAATLGIDNRLLAFPELGLSLDLNDAPAPAALDFAPAFAEMERIEAGHAVNSSENRQVGHYWLRAPELAPTAELQHGIRQTWDKVAQLGREQPQQVLLLGIGGSALGIQLVHDCLRTADTPEFVCLDNCDPQGIADGLALIDPRRARIVVASKSGRTNETMLALTAARAHWQKAGLDLGTSAIAVAGEDTYLAQSARTWRACVPVWDFVGGRTSVTSAVGLVPMALLGFDWRAFLHGAQMCDRITRLADPLRNPAARLAGLWWQEKRAHGLHALVFQPYRDRLRLLSAYLQQLIMESLGKRENRAGEPVHEGLNVFGNKGSTDQHSLMQQLIEGQPGTLVHFVETLTHETSLVAHESGLTCDHLVAALYGTRQALQAAGRSSVTLAVHGTDAFSLGVLIALFERAVGLYAGLASINAYDQPGVEAGKKAGRANLLLIAAIERELNDAPLGVNELAARVAAPAPLVWRLANHLAHTGRAMVHHGGQALDDRFSRATLPVQPSP